MITRYLFYFLPAFLALAPAFAVLDVQPSEIVFPAEGGSVQATVTSLQGGAPASWLVRVSELSVLPDRGDGGTEAVTITAGPNPGGARIFRVSVVGGDGERFDLTVSQDGCAAADAITVDAPDVVPECGGGVAFVATAASGRIPFLEVTSGPGFFDGNGILQITGTGTISWRASLETDSSFCAAAVTGSLTSASCAQSFDFSAIPFIWFECDGDLELAVTASSGLPVDVEIVSGPASVDESDILNIDSSGIVEIRATQAGDGVFLPAEETIQLAVVVCNEIPLSASLVRFIEFSFEAIETGFFTRRYAIYSSATPDFADEVLIEEVSSSGGTVTRMVEIVEDRRFFRAELLPGSPITFPSR